MLAVAFHHLVGSRLLKFEPGKRPCCPSIALCTRNRPSDGQRSHAPLFQHFLMVAVAPSLYGLHV